MLHVCVTGFKELIPSKPPPCNDFHTKKDISVILGLRNINNADFGNTCDESWLNWLVFEG